MVKQVLTALYNSDPLTQTIIPICLPSSRPHALAVSEMRSKGCSTLSKGTQCPWLVAAHDEAYMQGLIFTHEVKTILQ